MSVDRRNFLLASGALAASAAYSLACRTSADHREPTLPFLHGVASGDPLADRVILWTRVSPPPATQRISVRWEVAQDPGLRQIVTRGRVSTGPEQDFTLKVDATGLRPGRTYYYRFNALGEASTIGRTRTLPVDSVKRLRLACCSCANYPQGFFNAYKNIARRADLDAVVHLGDYLYEYGRDGYGGDAGLGRDVRPAHETLSLADYRERHAWYKLDPDLQAVHQQHPFIAVWDDHESADNAWMHGAANHTPGQEGSWSMRKAAAIRAYHEWMPIRSQTGGLAAGRIYRAFRFGDLADLVMLDTRLAGRDLQAARGDSQGPGDPKRRLLDAPQEAWMRAQLEASRDAGTHWRLLGQQVVMGSMSPKGYPINPDSWDGYSGSRRRLLDHLETAGIRDLVVLSGDVHSSWALEIAQDPFSPSLYDPHTGRGSLAVEFVTPAVSSSPLGSFPEARSLGDLDARRPHIRWANLFERGYTLLDIDAERSQAEWYFQETVSQRSAGERFARAFATARGENRLQSVQTPASAPVHPPELAPLS